MKILKNLFNILSWIVYIAIFCYILIVAPMVAGYKPVVVLSGSMEPTYHVGSVIYYKSTSFADIQEGDAVTFKAGDHALVTHRVVKRNDLSATFVTKGDANSTEDANPVEFSDIVGKASKLTIPYAGYFISLGKNIPVIVVMAAIIVISVLLDSLFPKKKREKERAEVNGEKQ